MVTGIELIRYQTKYRPNDHQKLPSKKPLAALIDELIRCYVRNKVNTLLYIHSAIFIDVALCSLNQLKIRKSVFTFTWSNSLLSQVKFEKKTDIQSLHNCCDKF